ncbi:hypothetical protein [Methylopila sp. 73B]|uniref:hypothetical protein n=1 Tax=Methylopila sp. 73B TaxID=1120792 RepID=UPI000379A553|nr:hypothetical protein [Methylopila sp. 73B]
MNTSMKMLASGALAAAMLVAPVAAFAQTSGTAQSTGDRENAKERSEMDTTRKHQAASPMKAKKHSQKKSGAKKPVAPTNTRS